MKRRPPSPRRPRPPVENTHPAPAHTGRQQRASATGHASVCTLAGRVVAQAGRSSMLAASRTRARRGQPRTCEPVAEKQLSRSARGNGGACRRWPRPRLLALCLADQPCCRSALLPLCLAALLPCCCSAASACFGVDDLAAEGTRARSGSFSTPSSASPPAPTPATASPPGRTWNLFLGP